MAQKDKFSNASGRLLTKALFYETTLEDKYGVLFTLKDDDHVVNGIIYQSLYRLYMEENDPTEYNFATKHLGGWGHWMMLCECNWFKEHLDRWRWEIELKVKAAALKRIEEEAKGEGKAKFAANRFLVDGGWIPKERAKANVGRPTQERIKKEAERLNQIDRDINEDFARLN